MAVAVARLPRSGLRGALRLRELRRDPLGFLDTVRELGDVVHLRVPRRDVYFVVHPAVAHEVLVGGQHRFTKSSGRRSTRVSRALAGGELIDRALHFPADDGFWARHRTVVNGALGRPPVLGHADAMVRCAEELGASWRDGDVVDVDAELASLNLRVVVETLFAAPAADLRSAVQASRIVMTELARRMGSLALLPMIVPTPRHRAFVRAVHSLSALLESLVESHAGGSELFSVLHGDGSRLHRRFQLMTLLLAGYETTALSLVWALHLLATHPQEQALLHAELDAVLGGRPPVAADLPRLTRTESVLHESLRLYPPVWVFGLREAVEDCVLAGALVRRGSLVVVSPWVTQRHPEVFDEPERFRPERWRTGARPHVAAGFFPFSAGERHCVGHLFAMTEATLTLASLAQRWRVEPVRPVGLEPTVTLRPRDGLPLRVRRRAAA